MLPSIRYLLRRCCSLARDVRGVAAVEYAVLLAVIVLIGVGAVALVGLNVKDTTGQMASDLKAAGPSYNYHAPESARP